jgi:hypothetical protein
MAIWAANVLRTLETVGWQHAEAVLRVVVRNLLGEKSDMALQSYPGNSERVRKTIGKLPATWAENVSDRGFVREFLALWRESTAVPRDQSPRRGEFPGIFDSRMTPHAIKKREAACDLVASGLVGGRIRAGAVWDAVHLAVGELILSAHRGSEAGHSNTVTNALHYAFEVSAEPANRLLALLQAVGWLFHFRENMADKDWLNEPRPITDIVAAKIPDDPAEAVEEILAHLSYGPTGKPPTVDHTYRGPAYLTPSWRHEAARKAFAFARKFPDSRPLFGAANRLLPLKTGWDPHPIKYALAARENCRWVSPEWQPNLLAAASCLFFGVDAPDNDVADQIREAVRRL